MIAGFMNYVNVYNLYTNMRDKIFCSLNNIDPRSFLAKKKVLEDIATAIKTEGEHWTFQLAGDDPHLRGADLQCIHCKTCGNYMYNACDSLTIPGHLVCTCFCETKCPDYECKKCITKDGRLRSILRAILSGAFKDNSNSHWIYYFKTNIPGYYKDRMNVQLQCINCDRCGDCIKHRDPPSKHTWANHIYCKCDVVDVI
jgi:hypothetical protein